MALADGFGDWAFSEAGADVFTSAVAEGRATDCFPRAGGSARFAAGAVVFFVAFFCLTGGAFFTAAFFFGAAWRLAGLGFFFTACFPFAGFPALFKPRATDLVGFGFFFARVGPGVFFLAMRAVLEGSG